MANHISNVLYFDADQDTWNEFRTAVTNEEGNFDFNKIIPMPENVDDEWDWMYENWGNRGIYAYSEFGVPEQPEPLSFETLNGHCLPVIEKLSEMFPNVRILYRTGGFEAFVHIEVILVNNHCHYYYRDKEDYFNEEQYEETTIGKLKNIIRKLDTAGEYKIIYSTYVEQVEGVEAKPKTHFMSNQSRG